jgi:hypothetical protein
MRHSDNFMCGPPLGPEPELDDAPPVSGRLAGFVLCALSGAVIGAVLTWLLLRV